jgi:hypothetical protein
MDMIRKMPERDAVLIDCPCHRDESAHETNRIDADFAVS